MTFLRNLILAVFLVFALYSVAVISSHGFDFMTPFMTGIFAVNWSGQFNLDFAGYLMLSALWIAWRHKFSAQGVAIAATCGIGGLLIFAPYLIYAINKSKGNFAALLLGEQGADNRS